MNSLPEKLEERILTCDTESFLRLQEMSKGDYYYKSIHAKVSCDCSSHSETSTLYRALVARMLEMDAIAVTDLKVNTLLNPIRNESMTTAYGTAIVPRNPVRETNNTHNGA